MPAAIFSLANGFRTINRSAKVCWLSESALGSLHHLPEGPSGCRSRSLGTSPFASFSTGIGAGLRYNLPVGPLRVDYGVNPSPRANEDFGAFHLSFGFAF